MRPGYGEFQHPALVDVVVPVHRAFDVAPDDQVAVFPAPAIRITGLGMVSGEPGAEAVDLVIDVVQTLGTFRHGADERLAAVIAGHRTVRGEIFRGDILVIACEREVDALVVPDNLGLGLLLLAGLVPREHERPHRLGLPPGGFIENAVHHHPAARLHGGVFRRRCESGRGHPPQNHQHAENPQPHILPFLLEPFKNPAPFHGARTRSLRLLECQVNTVA